MENSLAIGIPSGDLVQMDMVLCLLQTIRTLEIPYAVINSKSCYVARNRNEIVRQAQEYKVSHLMFIDTDMAFENEGINKLLVQDKDIIGGMYNKRRLPLTNIVQDFKNQTKTFESSWIPTGFMLIKMSVFDKIEGPWFESNSKEWSEDKYFCELAIKNGFKVHCDPTIKLKHIGNYPY